MFYDFRVDFGGVSSVLFLVFIRNKGFNMCFCCLFVKYRHSLVSELVSWVRYRFVELREAVRVGLASVSFIIVFLEAGDALACLIT